MRSTITHDRFESLKEYLCAENLKPRSEAWWIEECPTPSCWVFRSRDGRYLAVINWYQRMVGIRRLRP